MSENSADMCGHIIRAFGRVFKEWVSVYNHPRHKGFEIAAYRGVCVFAQNQRCAGMLNKNLAGSRGDTAFCYHIGNLPTDVYRFATAGLNFNNSLTDQFSSLPPFVLARLDPVALLFSSSVVPIVRAVAPLFCANRQR